LEASIDPLVSQSHQHPARMYWTGEPRDLALRIAEILADTPASDTLVLDVHEISSVADYFVICSAENERQLRAISTQLQEKLEEQNAHPHRTEGTPQSGWMVLDYGDSIVHVFDVDQRAYYRLESLWAEAQTLVAME
jgi:ribosome-associated protein